MGKMDTNTANDSIPGGCPCAGGQPLDSNAFPMAPDAHAPCCTHPDPVGDRLPPAGDAPCCGSPVSMKSRPHERPGYTLCSFVKDFSHTQAGPVPVVATRLNRDDVLGTVRARLGLDRDNYRIAPGIYAVGSPGRDAPVLVTANYKLSFDALRKALTGASLWILVLETYGVNVWCSAGKRSFSDEEVIRRVKATGIDKVVDHRKLVLPQLSATGVSARAVKKGCGFKVIWGPIRAVDVRAFLKNGMVADAAMRRVTFRTAERLVLTPVEIVLLKKYLGWLLVAVFVLSGIGPGFFSFGSAWSRGWIMAAACAMGVIAGTVAAPALLPVLPGKAFSVKGVVVGVAAGMLTVLLFRGRINGLAALSLLLAVTALSSFLAMNFTGSTPYTSPSGVEKEMRKAIPFQAAAVAAAVIAWVGSTFTG